MPQSSTRLPQPKNWQDFERQTCELFRLYLKHPSVQLYGRSGQRQRGVDAFGYRNGNPDQVVGIQCKKKFDRPVSEAELRAEFDKAKLFEPRLSEYFLVTTAPRDVAIQSVALRITEESRKAGTDIHVQVWGWDDIEEEASRHAEGFQIFDPTFTPYVETATQEIKGELAEILRRLDDIGGTPQLERSSPATVITESVDEQGTAIQASIEVLRRMTDRGDANASLTELNGLRAQHWEEMPPPERYTLLVAIAAALLRLGRRNEAGQTLLDAVNEHPDHSNAKINRAKALLLGDDFVEAANVASEILIENPLNAEAGSILVQSRAVADPDTDPLEGIADGIRESREVLTGLVEYQRTFDDKKWVSTAISAAAQYQDDQVLRILSAEAWLSHIFDEYRGSLLGGLIPDDIRQNFLQAVETLATTAEEAIQQGTDLPNSLAHNTALGLRASDQLDRAVRILDEGLARYPESEELRFERAIIEKIRKEPSEVIAILPENPDGIPLRCLRADTLAELGEIEAALELLEATDVDDLSDVFWHARPHHEGALPLASRQTWRGDSNCRQVY